MRTTVQTHAMDAALALGALGAAFLTFQSLGLAASIAAALVVGVVGARRGLSLPLALASASAAGAALIHFAVAPEHFSEWWGFGLFFVLCGEVQLGWALLLGCRRPGGRMRAFGAAGSLFLVLTWAVSRTAGLPFGPDPGVAEAVAVPDVASVVLELVTAAACGWALLGPRRLHPWHATPVRAFALGGAVALTAWALAAVGSA